MEPVYYIIAILGCTDGSECTSVATLPTHYATEQECSARTSQALLANSDLDFPTLVAECHATDPRTIAAEERPERLPEAIRRG